VKKSHETSLTVSLARIFAVVAVGTATLIASELCTWVISEPAEVWAIRAFRIVLELFLASLLWITIVRKESSLNLQTAVMEAAANAILITDSAGAIVWVNRAFAELTGYSREEVIGKNPRILKSFEHDHIFYEQLWSTIQSGKVWRGEIRNRKKDGSLYTEEMTITPVLSGGRISYYIDIKQDITEKKKLEAQYRQAQKMEAVGRLAGGIAHDFNNILGVILGFSELSLAKLEAGHPVAKHLAQIKVATERAARLTKQLLAFSRQQVSYPRVVDLNPVVEQLGDMLQRVVGDDIAIRLKLSRPLGNLRADVGQLEQVLMNLIVNARDAISDTGEITIETRDVELDHSYQRQHEPVVPGNYVMLSVSDSGCGMTEETKSRIFEPFFTTKEPGKGTGLGLSTVYGIVKQNAGYIWVYSEPQKGTTFKLYFPRVNEAAEKVSRPVPINQSVGAGQTILLAEDDDGLREFIATILEEANYLVLQARSAQTAVELMKNNNGAVHLLLSDIVMPNTSGVKLVETLRAEIPNLKVILMSGYAADMLSRYAPNPQNAAFIEKPFSRNTLLLKVAEVLANELTR
jgi:two-component system, cell cycle sensor histidine kinase and response regulator CckA